MTRARIPGSTPPSIPPDPGVTERSFAWRAFLSEGPLFIGILNLTPDSFSDGGLHTSPAAALLQARNLLANGFRMLDLGAESTRPGAEPLEPDEEWDRLHPVLKLLRRELPTIPLSVDTRHSEVAALALAHGASVLNDVTGFQDEAMLSLATSTTCGLIAMRSRQQAGRFIMPPYGDAPVFPPEQSLSELKIIAHRIHNADIAQERVALDPGFGFGTTYQEDLALWDSLPESCAALGWPTDQLCLGISRKRFTAWKAGNPGLGARERDVITARLHREAMDRGIRIFRSHAATLAP